MQTDLFNPPEEKKPEEKPTTGTWTKKPGKRYDPKSREPFRLSRSKLENFLKCPRCFYLDRRLGVAQPAGFPFNLNSAVDHLLKKEFDLHRARAEAHPLMKKYGLAAVPFAHPDLALWRDNFKGVTYLHPPTNFLVTGALDDVWINPAGELLVVDYKSTAKDSAVTLDADWQRAYKNQIEVYQWLLRRNGFTVSPTAYFVYANGRRDLAAFAGRLEFEVVLLPYQGDDQWVDGALVRAKECLESTVLPAAQQGCDYCAYRQEACQVEHPQPH